MGPDAGIGAWCRHERHAALRLVVDVQEIRGEIVGRLTAPRDDCTSAEVHRRMAEIYGNVKEPVDSSGSPVVAWLAEACVRYAGRSLPIAGAGNQVIDPGGSPARS